MRTQFIELSVLKGTSYKKCLVNVNEIISISPSENRDSERFYVEVLCRPGTTSHWQGALATSSTSRQCKGSYENVVRQLTE